MSTLTQVDPEIAGAIEHEEMRQRRNLVLIASENYVSRAVLEAQGSVMTNKYAEGYPGRRYYGGCEFVDVAEQLAIDRLKDVQVEGGHLCIRVGIMKELVGIFPLENSGEHPSCRGPDLVQAKGVGPTMREPVESAFDDTDGKEHQRIYRGVFFGGPKENLGVAISLMQAQACIDREDLVANTQ